MDIDEICKVGQWLNFRAGTCFGETKDHLGLFVAISDDLAICVAVNATSNVDGVKEFANHRHIDADKTVVIIAPDAIEASLHFSKETAFDCNRPSIINFIKIEEWIRSHKIEIVDYNVEVNEDLLFKIRAGILRSPLVAKKFKNLIKLGEN